MKILLVHNNYAQPSGEEAVVDKMNELFRSLGHEVSEFRMSTAGLRDNLKGKIKGFIAGLYSPAGVKAMAKALDDEKPDVVNVHNLYPFISPAALRECKKRGIPVIMTVHNYRLICPTGLFLRDNKACEYCLQKGNEWGCVKYNCENSLLKSIGYASRNAVARLKKHYLECVDKFACLTEFQRSKLIEAGFPPSKLFVIPNSIPLPVLSAPSHYGEGLGGAPYIAYSGRISREKGVHLIQEVARKHPEIQFKLAGSIRDEQLIDKLPSNVTLMGFLEKEELQKFYRNASFFVMASTCYEGFPIAALEAGAYGKPMVAPSHGGFPEIIEDGKTGMLFTPGSVDSLEKAILKLWNNPELAYELGQNAFNKVSSQYSSSHISTLWQSLLPPLKKVAKF